MNRCVAVLGLALTVCGSVVAGQTAPTTPPAPATGQTPATPAGGFSNAYPRRLMPLGSARPQQGQVAVRVESVGPQRTRIHLTTDGVEQATLESTGFTVTTDASGTTITASGPVTFTTADGNTFSVGGLEVRIAPSGTSFQVRSAGTSQPRTP